MKLSARNDIVGKVAAITKGQVMAKVKVDIGGQFLTSLVSVDAVDDLALAIGDEIHVIVKSTEVILGK
ncbi:MAG: TOBE domain-containing protein [Magnetospirillum sp.]|nr:TOBE domain-containing protein [Magnetospirillum sp.]